MSWKKKSDVIAPNPKQKIKNATALTVDGIKFRSKLEAYTYRRLSGEGIDSDYELHRYNLLDKNVFEGTIYEPHKVKGIKAFREVSNNIRAITYTPDFVNTEDKWVIEVKGYANDVFPLKWKMFKALAEIQGYTLYLPSTQKQVRETVELIKMEKKYEKNKEILV
jgi:hypothetical protein